MADHINNSLSIVSANAKKANMMAAAAIAADAGAGPIGTPLQPLKNPNPSPKEPKEPNTNAIPGAFRDTYPSDDENLADDFNFNTAGPGDKIGGTAFAHRPRPPIELIPNGDRRRSARKDSALEVDAKDVFDSDDGDGDSQHTNDDLEPMNYREQETIDGIITKAGKPMHKITMEDAKELQRQAVRSLLPSPIVNPLFDQTC